MGMVGLRDLFLVAPAFHHHHHHHQRDAVGAITGPNAAAADHQINGTAATALGVGVIPLLTAGPCLAAAAAPPPPPPQNVEETDLNFLSSNSRNNKLAGVQLWQNQPQSQTQYLHFKNQPTVISPMNLMQTGVGPSAATAATGVGSNSSSGGGIATCQDCGNQAKKECSHKRCRTCCKSRGFACATHVKSTWVPAARRRERQLMAAGAGSSVSTSGTKKPRLIGSQQQQQTQKQQQTTSHTSTSNTTPQSFDTSSSHQEGGVREGWPGLIRAPAVFKCVRVTALEDGEDEYAYQAVVKIGGHVFKGFLYDQGIEPKEGIPNISELHLGGGGDNNNNRNNNGAASSSPIIEPDVYGSGGGGGGGGGGGFLGGSCYG